MPLPQTQKGHASVGQGYNPQVTGRIFDLQRYSTHDGPGIRTTLFLKGCPLRCRWCHNPESIAREPQLLFDAAKCLLDLACVEACPAGAVRFVGPTGEPVSRAAGSGTGGDPEAAPRAGERRYDADLCRRCGACAEVCFAGALELVGRTVTVAQALVELSRDQAFYAPSGGGITLSGGEPMLQPEFTGNLLAACRGAGLHTALDTTAYCRWDRLAAVLEHTDLVLLDLKHLDSNRHRRYTGVPNELILGNARKLGALMAARRRGGPGSASPAARPVRPPRASGIWIRVPVIPDVNDDDANMVATARFVRDQLAGAVEAVELLGYHRLGDAKRARLGWPADPAPWEPVGRARLRELACRWQTVLGPDGPLISAR